MKNEGYKPVPFDIEKTHKRWLRDANYRDAYATLADEFAALGEMLRARKAAGMTQADVAERMGIAQASVARLEASAGSRQHAPSVATLRRYADAVGCDLHITLTAKAKQSRRTTHKARASA
jgi:DNA-binding XRE family transcriptional regulator